MEGRTSRTWTGRRCCQVIRLVALADLVAVTWAFAALWFGILATLHSRMRHKCGPIALQLSHLLRSCLCHKRNRTEVQVSRSLVVRPEVHAFHSARRVILALQVFCRRSPGHSYCGLPFIAIRRRTLQLSPNIRKAPSMSRFDPMQSLVLFLQLQTLNS